MNRLAGLTLTLLFSLLTTISTYAQNADHIKWLYDVSEARQLAATENKLVLLHFSASWCAPCKELERFVFVNPMTIRAITGQVVPVKVDIDLNGELAKEYGVKSVPYDVIITPAGHVVTERSSPRSSDGYLAMVETAKSSAGNLSDEVVQQMADLRQEISQQRQAHEVAQNQAQSYGSLPAAEANQFQANLPATPTNAPNLQAPTPWSVGQTPTPPGVTPPDNMQIAENPRSSSFQPGPISHSGLPKVNPPSDQLATGQTRVTNRFANAATQPTNPSGQGQFQASTNPATTSGFQANGGGSFAPEGSQSRNQNPYQPALVKKQEPAKPLRIVNPLATGGASGQMSRNSSTIKQVSGTEPKLGLEGYCAVTLVENQRWVKGSKEWGCIHRGRLYLFASQQLRDQFQMTPDMFSPLLGGADPIEYHQAGQLVDGQRKHGVFYGDDGGPSVIVLFQNKMNRDTFEANPTEYLRTVRQAMSRLDDNPLLR